MMNHLEDLESIPPWVGDDLGDVERMRLLWRLSKELLESCYYYQMTVDDLDTVSLREPYPTEFRKHAEDTYQNAKDSIKEIVKYFYLIEEPLRVFGGYCGELPGTEMTRYLEDSMHEPVEEDKDLYNQHMEESRITLNQKIDRLEESGLRLLGYIKRRAFYMADSKLTQELRDMPIGGTVAEIKQDEPSPVWSIPMSKQDAAEMIGIDYANKLSRLMVNMQEGRDYIKLNRQTWIFNTNVPLFASLSKNLDTTQNNTE